MTTTPQTPSASGPAAIARAAVLVAARAWIGTPFVHQGRIRGRGMDCAGLPLMVACELGITGKNGEKPTANMFGNYPPQPVARAAAVAKWCQSLLVEKPIAQRLPGDVLALRLPLEPCHCAIVAELDISRMKIPSMIHAYAGAGKVVEHILDNRWSWRIVGCYSFPGVEPTWR